MMNKFLKWWSRQTTTWIIIMAVIQIIQVPHMVWNADMMLEQGYVSRVHPAIDWLLYGVDLVEIPSILIAFTTITARLKVRKKKYRCDW